MAMLAFILWFPTNGWSTAKTLRREEKVMNTVNTHFRQNGCLFDRWYHDDPILATFIYSISSRWGRGKNNPAWRFYSGLVHQSAERSSLLTSLRPFTVYLCGLLVSLSVVLILPAIFVVFLLFPETRQGHEYHDLITVRGAPVVSSVGLLQLYADSEISLIGTPWLIEYLLHHRVAIHVSRNCQQLWSNQPARLDGRGSPARCKH